MILLIILSALFLQSKAQDGFRYDANGLQILINSEWFYVVNTPTFSFMEANFICTEFLDSKFLRYQIVTVPGLCKTLSTNLLSEFLSAIILIKRITWN